MADKNDSNSPGAPTVGCHVAVVWSVDQVLRSRRVRVMCVAHGDVGAL